MPDSDSNGSFRRTAAAIAAATLLTLSGMSAPPPIMASPGSTAEQQAPAAATAKPVEQGSMTMQVKAGGCAAGESLNKGDLQQVG